MLQLKAFYSWLEQNNLSMGGIVLWHGLMYLWNQSFWSKNFTPSMVSIMARTSLSKSTVLRARGELVEAGLLELYPGKKRDITRYKLVPFSV